MDGMQTALMTSIMFNLGMPGHLLVQIMHSQSHVLYINKIDRISLWFLMVPQWRLVIVTVRPLPPKIGKLEGAANTQRNSRGHVSSQQPSTSFGALDVSV